MNNVMESNKNYAEMQVVSDMLTNPNFTEDDVLPELEVNAEDDVLPELEVNAVDDVLPALEVSAVDGLMQLPQYLVNIDTVLRYRGVGDYDSYDLVLDESYFDEYSVFLTSINVYPNILNAFAEVQEGQPIADFTLVDDVTGDTELISFFASQAGYVFFRANLGVNNYDHIEMVGFTSDAGVESILYTDGMESDCDLCVLYAPAGGAHLKSYDNFAVLGATCESNNIVAVKELYVQDSGFISDSFHLEIYSDTNVFGRLFVPISPNDLVA